MGRALGAGAGSGPCGGKPGLSPKQLLPPVHLFFCPASGSPESGAWKPGAHPLLNSLMAPGLGGSPLLHSGTESLVVSERRGGGSMAGSGERSSHLPCVRPGGRSGALSQAGMGTFFPLGTRGAETPPSPPPPRAFELRPTLGTGGRLGASQVEGSLLVWGERGLRRDVLGRGEELAKLSPLLLSWCLRPFWGLDSPIPSSPPRPSRSWVFESCPSEGLHPRGDWREGRTEAGGQRA